MAANFAFSQAAYFVDENTGTASFTVSVIRTGDINAAVTVNYATSDSTAIAGTDYIAALGSLVFNAGVTIQTFTVPILDNQQINLSKTLNLTLSDPIQGLQQTATLTIEDDDLTGEVTDSGSGTGVPTFLANEGSGDYDVPGQEGVNQWQQNFNRSSWLGRADVEFDYGQASIPLRIFDDAAVDGNDTIVWKINGSADFGFSKKTYTFSEEDAHNQNNGIVSIELSLDSNIKTATIIIKDSNSGFTRINGNANNNSLYGGNGKEIVYALAGNDYVDGRNGSDRLYGDSGNDTLLGNFGNDYLNGGSGKDKLYGNDNNDILNGFTDNDSLYGGAGHDVLLGWDGNDYLNGGDGNEILKGDAGNDTLAGGFGSDRLTGGAGADKFVFSSPSEGIDTILDFKRSEQDKIQVSASAFGIGQYQYNNFTFDSSTGDLFFGYTQLASLPINSSFVPSLDIIIV